MDMAEHPRRQPPRRILPDFLEQRVAEVVGQHPAEPRRGIGDDQHQRGGPRRRFAAHRVDHRLVGERHGQRDRLARQHQHHRDDDAQCEARRSSFGHSIGRKRHSTAKPPLGFSIWGGALLIAVMR